MKIALAQVDRKLPPFYAPQLYRDHFQNFKAYSIPRAQLVIADVPYNLGNNAYASNPAWYNGGDNANGESELAGKMFFESDGDFSPAHFMIFCQRLLRREKPDEKGGEIGKTGRRKSTAPCIVLFLPFEEMHRYIELAAGFGFAHYIPLVFRKPFSAQVLKANMKIVGNCEYGLVLYRDRLPKFNNDGQMVFNCFDWPSDGPEIPKCHPTQKPVALLKRLIEIFTDPGDVVIDPVAGSGSTLRAAAELGRRAFGFEIKKEFFASAQKKMLKDFQLSLFAQPASEAPRTAGEPGANTETRVMATRELESPAKGASSAQPSAPTNRRSSTRGDSRRDGAF